MKLFTNPVSALVEMNARTFCTSLTGELSFYSPRDINDPLPKLVLDINSRVAATKPRTWFGLYNDPINILFRYSSRVNKERIFKRYFWLAIFVLTCTLALLASRHMFTWVEGVAAAIGVVMGIIATMKHLEIRSLPLGKGDIETLRSFIEVLFIVGVRAGHGAAYQTPSVLDAKGSIEEKAKSFLVGVALESQHLARRNKNESAGLYKDMFEAYRGLLLGVGLISPELDFDSACKEGGEKDPVFPFTSEYV